MEQVPNRPHWTTILSLILLVGILAVVLPWFLQLLSSAASAVLGGGWLVFIVVPAALVGALLLLRAAARRRPEAEDNQSEQSKGLPPPNKVLASSHFRTITTERPATRFADVAGVEEAKEELAEVVDFLNSPAKFASVGARLPKGVLLVGPPGTGKTLLARAVAGEAGVPFISASGSEFVELYVGVGAARARTLFQEAKKHAPCIVFIDEIDAVGRRRGGNMGLSHEEREQTLNQILVELDGFDQQTNVIILAATNRADVLDPALLRPGRFDRQVMLDLPDAAGRQAILRIHAYSKPLAPGVDLAHVARQTTGLSGADLENVVNEAAIMAARGGRAELIHEDFEESVDRVTAGPRRKSRVLTEREKVITAHHEIGHALVAYVQPHADQVTKVSIVSRGIAGGYTRMVPEQDRNMWSQSEFEAAIAAALGGHVAEELIFAEVTTGPSNDLQRASELARRMVTEFGMSPQIGPLTITSSTGWGDGPGMQVFGEELARQIDTEVRRVLTTAHVQARSILAANLEVLRTAAQRLIECETLEREELERLFASASPAAEQTVPATEVSRAPASFSPRLAFAAADTARRSLLTRLRGGRRREAGPLRRSPIAASQRTQPGDR